MHEQNPVEWKTEMAQKIPFFELFHTLELPWEMRVTLDGSYLTAVEVDRETRTMVMDLTVQEDIGEQMGTLESAVTQAYGLTKATIHQKIVQPAQGSSPGGKKDGDIIMGGAIKGAVQPMTGLNPKMGNVIVAGRVFFADMYETRRPGVFCLTFDMTDFQTSVRVTKYMQKEEKDALKKDIKPGMWLKVQGYIKLNRDGSDIVLDPRNISTYPHEMRKDTAEVKRVELHMHTSFSNMDALSPLSPKAGPEGNIIKRAEAWGHPAIAITDHGVVQAFPEANHCFDAWGGVVPQDSDFKVIYGMEAYLVDDLKGIVDNSQGQSLHGTYVVFDIETTGFSAMKDKIIEIGAVRVEDGKITDRFSQFVNPQIPIPFRIQQLTSINDSMVQDAPTIDKVLPEFEQFCQGAVMVAHNAGFDMSFIKKNYEDLGIDREDTIVDTVGMARFLLPQLNRFKLDTVAKAVGVSLENHHRAVDDAECTAQIFVKFIKMCEERDIFDLDQLNEKGAVSVHTIQKMPTYHAIILAKNDVGRVNLYHLVSDSHLIYYNRRPRVPKSLYLKYQEGLMIGSACEAGELYQAVLNGRPDTEIARIVNFYDYLEIQPIGNNAFMLRDPDRDDIQTEEDLQEINRKIVKLGESFNKPVVATCDVHFLDPEDEVYRRIIMAGKGFDDADQQAPLYLRTTEEMLEGIADGTIILPGGYKVLEHEEIVEILVV